MKKITEEEFLQTPVKGRGRSSHVFNEIANLKPGEYLKIEKADWKKRQPPSRVASYIAKRRGKKFQTWSVLDNSGWIIKRIS